MPGALDWLMQRLGGEDTEGEGKPTAPLDLTAAFDEMTGSAADQAYWKWVRDKYGASPPDQGGRDPQIGPGLPRGLGEDVWEGAPLAPQYPQSQRDMPSVVNPPEGMRRPTIRPLPDWDYTLPRDFTFDDQPFPDTRYRRRNPLSDPWAMLKVAPLNQMFRAYADPWAMDPDVRQAALKARRRIPGLY